jgi:hypothetical protein
MNKLERLLEAFEKAERAFVANPNDETAARFQDAEQMLNDESEIAAGGTPERWGVVEWSL